MAARISAAQARQLSLDGFKTPPKRGTRKTAAGPYRTQCATCEVVFTTMASEDRHVAETRHARYEVLFEVLAPC